MPVKAGAFREAHGESRMKTFLIAQNDDPELLEWLSKAHTEGGHFVRGVAMAALFADHENYPLIRPMILELRKKYPQYEPSDLVKQEIRDRSTT
jgi:hypothetical protein